MEALPTGYFDTLLEGFERATALFATVKSFYGEKLSLLASSNKGGTSSFGIMGDARTGEFQEARIELNINTDRVIAAAVHELLHLHLRTLGFPAVALFPAVPEPMLERRLTQLCNVIEHQVFVDDFQRIGLPLSQFLAPIDDWNEFEAVQNKNMQILALMRPPADLEWLPHALWMIDFLDDLMASEQGRLGMGLLIERRVELGKRIFPTFSSTEDALRSWVAEGAYHSADGFYTELEGLLRILRIPYPPVCFWLVRNTTGNLSMSR